MKKLLLLLFALAGAVSASAQLSDGVSATLIDGDTTKVFYGYDSFRNAYAAAKQTGCTIVLSPGAFSTQEYINKSVKVYGAGFQPDKESGVGDTRIMGHVRIQSTDDFTPEDVHLEGLYVTNNIYVTGPKVISGLEIVKCRMENFYQQAPTSGTIIRQSYIKGSIGGENKVGDSFVVSNCYLQVINNFAAGSQLMVANSVLTHGDCIHSAALYKNCIFSSNYYGGGFRSGSIGAGSTCYNNVGWQGCIECNQNNVYADNYYEGVWGGKWNAFFADGQDNLNYTDTDGNPRTWELAEPEKYVGTDGTPCGLTGGDFPWNPIPTQPRIVSTSVDAKSVPGKLKVNIKAEARPLE